jgi:hypothetical protein
LISILKIKKLAMVIIIFDVKILEFYLVNQSL